MSKPRTIRPAPPIHPDLLVAQASSPETRAAPERISFMTKEWNIPERPKPGRKPKEPKQPRSSNPPKNMDRKAAPGSNSKESTIIPHCLGTKDSGDSSAVSRLGSDAANSLQQKYIDLLEQKVQSLQEEQSKGVDHYKTLAVELGSKAERFQAENGVLRSQLEVLRNEVIRLRKKISFSLDKSSTESSKVRKEPTGADDRLSTRGDHAASKKARTQSIQIDSPSLNPSSQQVPDAPGTHPSLLARLTVSCKGAVNPVFMKTGASHFSSLDNGCGLCTSELDCICRQVGLRATPTTLDVSEQDLSSSLSVPIRTRVQAPAGMPSRPSLWNIVSQEENLQAVRSDSSRSVAINQDAKRDCSGNPSDCPACCDDAFGKAFCTAISNSSSAQKSDTSSTKTMAPKIARSDPMMDAYTSIPCCGEPELCGSKACFEVEECEPMISCSEAWRQLKVHPNIGNANLQLLADVVARQSASTKTLGREADPEKPDSSLISKSTTSLDSRGALQNDENVSSGWTDGPHGTLAAVFENVRQSKHTVGSGSENHMIDSSPPSESEDGSGNRRIKFVAKRSLREALVMLDGAGV